MMRELTVGVFGVTIFNRNLGCQALSWSLMKLLKTVSAQSETRFHFIVFDRSIHDDTNRVFEKAMGLERQEITYVIGSSPRLYRISQNKTFSKAVKQCDLIVDITEGDSFSDIYGQKRFLTWSLEKWYVQHCGIPLLLGPQTYGPFMKSRNEKMAMRIIDKAVQVVSRDYLSMEYIQSKLEKDVVDGTDAAFSLPFHPAEKRNGGLIRIGVNPSGLLWGNAIHTRNDLKAAYSVYYPEYMFRLIEQLLQSGKYEVLLIKHVKNDEQATQEIMKRYPAVNVVPFFRTAVEAKSYLSGLDCLIASRMHATIAAFSAGVPVIPVSYSRKFEGLYHSLGYDHLVSMEDETTDSAIHKTMAMLEKLEVLNTDRKRGVDIAQEKTKQMEKAMTELVLQIAQSKTIGTSA